MITVQSLLAGVAPGALSTAILIVNNVRDIDEDRAANKKTLAVRFGLNFGKIEYLFAILLTPSSDLFFSDTPLFPPCSQHLPTGNPIDKTDDPPHRSPPT